MTKKKGFSEELRDFDAEKIEDIIDKVAQGYFF